MAKKTTEVISKTTEEVDGKGRLGVDVKVLSVLASEVISKWPKSDIAICRFVSRAWRSVTWTGEFYRNYRNNHPVTVYECKVAVYDPSDNECDSFGFCTYFLGEKLPPPPPSEDDISDLPPEFSVLASLDGMLVLAQRTGIWERAYVKLLIYNPLTLWARELPPLPGLYLSSRSDPVGFYIDPDDGFDYKVLCLSLSGPYGAFVFSHRRRSWTAVEFDHDELLNHPGETLATWSPSTPTTWGQRLFFNLSYDDDSYDDKFIGRGRIICFDVRTETFSQTSFPRPQDAQTSYSSSLAVVDGRLHLYVTCHATDDLPLRVHVWKLKDDVGAVVDDRDWVNVAYIEGPSPLHRVCTEPAGNWVAVLDEGDNSFQKVGAEDFKARYRRLLHPTYTYGRNRVIYVPSVVHPCPPDLIE